MFYCLPVKMIVTEIYSMF